MKLKELFNLSKKDPEAFKKEFEKNLPHYEERLANDDLEKEFPDFRDAIALLLSSVTPSKLLSLDFLYFGKNVSEYLSKAFNKDKAAYIDYLKEYPKDSLPPITFQHNPTNLLYYLPYVYDSLYSSSVLSQLDGKSSKQLAELIEIYPPIGKKLYRVLVLGARNETIINLGDWKNQKDAPDTKLFFQKLAEIVPAYREFTQREVQGIHYLDDGGTLSVSEKYITLKPHHATKNALVLYGYDYNGEFSNELDSDAEKLYQAGYNVLVIDARKQVLALEDIPESLIDAKMQDLDLVHINMHGGDPLIIHDTIVSFNNKKKAFLETSVLMHDLFEHILRSVENKDKPLKVVLGSCHSQLAVERLTKMLPTGSEIAALSEDQVLGDKHYYRPSYANHYRGDSGFYVEDKLPLSLGKAAFHFATYPELMASYTYAKIGECIYTPINLPKEEVSKLLESFSKDEVAIEVVKQLGKGEVTTDRLIYEHTIKLLDRVITSEEEYALPSIREKESEEFNEAVAVAGAIYDIYGQCGKKILADSYYIKTEEWKIAEFTAPWIFRTLGKPIMIAYESIFGSEESRGAGIGARESTGSSAPKQQISTPSHIPFPIQSSSDVVTQLQLGMALWSIGQNFISATSKIITSNFGADAKEEEKLSAEFTAKQMLKDTRGKLSVVSTEIAEIRAQSIRILTELWDPDDRKLNENLEREGVSKEHYQQLRLNHQKIKSLYDQSIDKTIELHELQKDLKELSMSETAKKAQITKLEKQCLKLKDQTDKLLGTLQEINRNIDVLPKESWRDFGTLPKKPLYWKRKTLPKNHKKPAIARKDRGNPLSPGHSW